MEIPGHGSKLYLASVASPAVYTAIAQCTTIGGPTMANGEKDDTDLDDVNKKSSATLIDPGELSLTLNYDPLSATHVTLLELLVSGDEVNWRLVFNDHVTEASRSKAEFSGWVKSFAPTGFETEANVTADLAIRINTIPVVTPRV